jgi:hypothetical protein
MGSRKIRLAGGQFQRQRAFCGGGSAFPWATGDVTRGNGVACTRMASRGGRVAAGALCTWCVEAVEGRTRARGGFPRRHARRRGEKQGRLGGAVWRARAASRGEGWGQGKQKWAGWQARDSGWPNRGGQSQRRRPAKVPSRREVEEELEDLVGKTKKFRGLSIK